MSGKVIYVLADHERETVVRKGVLYRRVTGRHYGALAGGVFTNAIPEKHRAVNMHEIGESNALATHQFENDVCPNTGMTDQQLVKSGKATTRDMKPWV